MLTFWRKKLRVTDPEARSRIDALLRSHGPLFLEAAFRHVSSDYYVLAGPEDVDGLFDWFKGRRGGATPLYVDPAEALVSRAKPLVDTDTSAPGCSDLVEGAIEKHAILLEASLPDDRKAFRVIDDEEEWEALYATLPPATPIRVYDTLGLRGRRSALIVWAE